MSYNNDDGPSNSGATLQKIEQAILRVGRARQQYIEQCQAGTISPRLQREFHSAVINYYIELRPFRDNKAISDDWDDVKLWTDNNGEPVTGFDTLLDWVDMKRPSQTKVPGRANNRTETLEPDTLPAEKLLHISMELDDIAHELGFAPDSKTPIADPTEAMV